MEAQDLSCLTAFTFKYRAATGNIGSFVYALLSTDA